MKKALTILLAVVALAKWVASNSHVLATVREDGMQLRDEQWPAADKEAFMDDIRERYDLEGHPFFASARLWDDGVIDPAATRDVLGLAMAFANRKPERSASTFGIFRM